MVNTNYRSFRADERSYFALIKKDIQKMAAHAGFGEVRGGKVDIIISEVTSNLYKHAHGGEILAGLGKEGSREYIEIVCLDDGPGIGDLNRVLADGYSSASTLGHGLGAIRRLSDLFDMYSIKAWGSVIVSRVYKDEPDGNFKRKYDFEALNVPKPPESVSGDGYCVKEMEDGFRVLVADGLGHGDPAHGAVLKACEAFQQCEEESATETVRRIHEQIRKTRGIVGLVVIYHAPTRTWRLVGVGNISVKWMGRSQGRSYHSYNGIIGHNIPGSLSDLVLSQEEFTQFIACSDGIKSRWDLAKFPTILKHHGTIIASAIYKEFARRTDDISVIVCKTI
jgi:anti-sigma regulatory factor (Ser/Thr protein kinase)